MNCIHKFAITAGCVAILAATASPASASAWDKRTTVTFPERIEVPGTTLEPGRYVMKLVDIASARNIVQFTNERENHVYATVIAIPTYREEPSSKTELAFYEAPAGQPEALKSWFYPGDNYGEEFYYPKGHGLLLSSTAATPTPLADRTTPAAQETDSATVPPFKTTGDVKSAETANSSEPASEPSSVAEAKPDQQSDPVLLAQNNAPDSSSASTPPAESTLPKTASSVGEFALFGLISVATGLLVRRSVLH